MSDSVNYRVRFTRQAEKDIAKLTDKLRAKLKDIVRNRLAVDPYSGKPLTGPLKGHWSMRLSYQDRIVYSIQEDDLVVIVVRARTHYGD
jgi:Txe/YoeB family toxin of toxin-antitoxin system